MRKYTKKDFPVSKIRRFLEPGPVVLITSKWRDQVNVMTQAWHTVMEFEPSLVGCMITSANYSYDLIAQSKECVINIPTSDLLETVVGIGNTTGAEINKFERFQLTTTAASKVKAPLIEQCYASFECKLHDGKMLEKYNFFVFEVVKAHVATSPKYPHTVHYRGDGIFMISGDHKNLRRKFLPENL